MAEQWAFSRYDTNEDGERVAVMISNDPPFSEQNFTREELAKHVLYLQQAELPHQVADYTLQNFDEPVT